MKMETRKNLRICVFAFVVVVCWLQVGLGEPMGTAFTYQGRLIDSNDVADGLYDLSFRLYDANVGGDKVGVDVNTPDVDVIDGYFTVELDFGGGVFDGNAVWLDIAVRAGAYEDPNRYISLSPRQEVTPTPYALHTYGLTVVGDNTFIGKDAGISNTTGYYNTFSGYEAGISNTEGYGNTFSGYHAGFKNTTGNRNTFSGIQAGNYNTTGQCNTFSGCMAGYKNKTGYNNTFSGYQAGQWNTEGYGNTFSGYKAGNKNTTGNNNTFSGYQAGLSNTEGNGNTFSGCMAGYSNTTGYGNTFSGYQAGQWNTEGGGNTFSGYQAGFNNTGYSNTFSGYQAGLNNTTGSYNTFSGYYAGHSNTTGSYNTFSGNEAGYSNTTGHSNTFSGYLAGHYNTEGHSNTFLGRSAGYCNTEGNYNTFLGRIAGYSNTTGSYNTISGYRAGSSNTEGHSNTFSGYYAGQSNTKGSYNTFSGYRAGYANAEGSSNTFLGSAAGHDNTTGSHNTFSGFHAGRSNTEGYNNIFLGSYAGYSNDTGHNNVFIGYRAGYSETGSNKLYIANSEVDPPLIYGDFSTGYVGIGTEDPKKKLHVEGDVYIDGHVSMDALDSGDAHFYVNNRMTGGNKYNGIKVDHEGGGYAGRFICPINDYPGVGVKGYGRASGGWHTGSPDIAEWIKVSDPVISAADVLVIDQDNSQSLRKSDSSYSTLAAGIVSTNPGFIAGYYLEDKKEMLDLRREDMEKAGYRMLALAGRVPCNVSAENGPIEIGDLLTTSATPGHAMKVTDKMRAMGAIVGKALEPLRSDKGQIMVLVTLQ
jgi:hypothetical protein